MNYEKGKEIVLEDGKSYAIADSFDLNNNKYLYVVEIETKEATLIKIINDTTYEIEDDNEFNEAFNELVRRNEEELIKNLKETIE